MSLRARLALVLAAVMVGPLVAAWIAIGVLVPHASAASDTTALTRAAAATSAYLGQQCLGLGDSARAVALAVSAGREAAVGAAAAGATAAGPAVAGPAVDPAVAQRAATATQDVALRRAGVSAFVLVDDVVIARAGPLAGRLDAATLAAASTGSCALRQTATAATPGAAAAGAPAAPELAAALVESVPVLDATGVRIARSVVIEPLDSAGLTAVRTVLGLGADVALVTRQTSPAGAAAPASTTSPTSTTPTAPATTVMSATTSVAALQPVLAALAGPGTGAGTGAVSGVAGGWRYQFEAAPPGVPYGVLVVSRVASSRLQLTLLVTAMVFMAVFGALLLVLTERLTGPLADLTRVAERLGTGDLAARSGIRGTDEVATLAAALDSMAGTVQTTFEELQAGRDALAQTFEQFGEALGHTHDLDGLLRTVVEAARQGAGASVGTALLGTEHTLAEQVSSVPDGAGGAWVGNAVDTLTMLALDAVRCAEPLLDNGSTVFLGRTDLAGTDPGGTDLGGTDLGRTDLGPTLAVPLLRGQEVVGALAIARSAGQAPFDPAAIAAVTALGAHAGTAVANVREHQETQRLSVTDPLTGVGNLRQLTSTLAREVERAHRFARPLSVLMLDLDHFKQVNDTHGHAFGDAVLREFARRLDGCLREVDLVSRCGGEEFAVVLPETGAEGAVAVASRIVDAIRGEAFSAAGQTRSVTVSVGIAAYPDHGLSSAEVMRSADAALYSAKRSGRDRWCMADDPVGTPHIGTDASIASHLL